MEKNKSSEAEVIKSASQFNQTAQTLYDRRTFLSTALKAGVAIGVANTLNLSSSWAIDKTTTVKSQFNFEPISHGFSPHHIVSKGHSADVLIRWGDRLFKDSPEFDVRQQTPESQELQFGFNNDYVGFLPLPKGPNQQDRALLCVNHEYPLDYMMFPELVYDEKGQTPENKQLKHVHIEQSSVGNSIVEIEKVGGHWQPVVPSIYNRRITARTTNIALSGPAAGCDRMKTSVDKTGKLAVGTFMNCAGGMTPWGTYLTCEENFNNVFTGEIKPVHKEYRNYERYQVNNRQSGWGEFDSRFHLSDEPNEANRFGWVVEIDPKDPNSTPKKRTALGRFKHEGAECVVSSDGRLVVYMGDDAYFEYLYKFVSKQKVDVEQSSNNQDLLDEGVLYVAQFKSDGSLTWLPLVYGASPLTNESGFNSQADVLIEARHAAQLVGATPLDRPEDVVPNKANGKVYVILTNNKNRTEAQVDAVNQRANNLFGQIIEIDEQGNFSQTHSNWNVLLRAGNPNEASVEAMWHPQISNSGWFACPDAGVIDHQGRFWISTDQGSEVSQLTGTNDGLWAVETEGTLKGSAKMFYRGPNGAEVTGPQFSTDGKALFLAIQHPGVDELGGRHNNLHSATSYWPDFTLGMPPRPSIVVIQNKAGDSIG